MTLILDHDHTNTFRNRNRSAVATWPSRAGTMLRRAAGSLVRTLGEIPRTVMSAAELTYVAPYKSFSQCSDRSNPERY